MINHIFYEFMCLNEISYLLSFPLLSLVIILRIDVNDHLGRVCAKTNVCCPFKEQGCMIRVFRRDVDKHLQENMLTHIFFIAKQNSSLTQQCSNLAEKNVSLTERCDSLSELNGLLKAELHKAKVSDYY
jgi:hypothetical protein